MTRQKFENSLDDVIARQDHVDNAIHELLEELAGKPIQWQLELIGSVRDCIEDEFVSRGLMTEDEFYPGMDEEVVDENAAS